MFQAISPPRPGGTTVTAVLLLVFATECMCTSRSTLIERIDTLNHGGNSRRRSIEPSGQLRINVNRTGQHRPVVEDDHVDL